MKQPNLHPRFQAKAEVASAAHGRDDLREMQQRADYEELAGRLQLLQARTDSADGGHVAVTW